MIYHILNKLSHFDILPSEKGEKMREKQATVGLFDEYYLAMAWSPRTNQLSKELDQIDRLLDEMPQILDAVQADLNGHLKSPSASAAGRSAEVTAEQALRCAILKQLRQFSYRTLASEIDITPIYRKFTRFYGASIPCFTTLERAIKTISAKTMDEIHAEIVRLSLRKKVEKGQAVRHDTTVVATDISYPTDAKLLNDCVRVITRLAGRLCEAAPEIPLSFCRHTRSAKKQAYRIAMAKGSHAEEARAESYKVLLKVQRKTREEAEAMLEAIRLRSKGAMRIEVRRWVDEMEKVLPLAKQVYDQAERRVLRNEKVPVDEKLVSIFETHTDIICRGKKSSKTEFGHKVDFATGRSGLVLRYEVLQGNPGDNEVLERALDDHIALFGKAPEKLTADRRYFSSDNERIAKEKGVQQVALPKPGWLSEVRKSVQNAPWFKKLLRWRAGVEGNLSTLLRSFGLKRCLWKGWESFKAYVGLGVMTYNLRLLAGHLASV